MSHAALDTLARHKQGFVAMIEGVSIDKEEHLMDTDRWLLEVPEFDRAIQVAKFTGVMDNTDVFFKLARIVGAR